MKQHQLKKNQVNKSKKRVGRGISAGGGKTTGRGTKGQRSRAGFNLPKKFEGGQTPLAMRLHKLKGFKSPKNDLVEISLDCISKHFKNGEMVTLEALQEKRIVNKEKQAKILNSGELKISIKIGNNVRASKSVLELISKTNNAVENKKDTSPSSKLK